MKYYIWSILLLAATIGVAQAALPNDLDEDGVPDGVDQCPNIPEDYDPQFGNVIDGCPADFVPWYDTDYDAIQDHLDFCPTVRENYNLYEDADGCPDTSPADPVTLVDSDGDGFIDVADLCPTRAETLNGIDDHDGCPDDYAVLRDSDSDGISGLAGLLPHCTRDVQSV